MAPTKVFQPKLCRPSKRRLTNTPHFDEISFLSFCLYVTDWLKPSTGISAGLFEVFVTDSQGSVRGWLLGRKEIESKFALYNLWEENRIIDGTVI